MMNVYLIIGATLSAIAALLHIGCMVFGAPWYRFFGAGEKMAVLAEQGSHKPTVITSFIVIALFVCSLYALSGAQIVPPLPLLRLALVVITVVYLIRGLLGFIFVFKPIENSPTFWFWSSMICSVFGLVHLLGLWQVWQVL